MTLSKGISIISWISVFALAWLILLDKIPATPVTWGFWAFFLAVAFVAGIGTRRQT